MIVKNEISNIEDLMSDVCPVLEQVVVVDTGSTDGTLDVLSRLQQKFSNLEVHQYQWKDHFSDARNYSFSFAKNDWVFWLDGDDRIDSNKLKDFKENTLDDSDVDAWMLDYNYAQLPNGEPQIILGRERFIRKSKNPKWIGAIHETVDIANMRMKHYYGLQVVHNRSGKVIEPQRNIRILQKEYSKNPNDPRTAYYYGKELFDRVDPNGIEILEKFLELPWKYWDDEINARFRLGKHYLVNGDFSKTVEQAEKIYHLDQTRLRAEAYWLWGSVEQQLKNYKVAARWFEWCLDDPPGPPRVLSKEYYTWNPRMRLVECYLEMGEKEKAQHHYDNLKKIMPNSPEMMLFADQLEIKPSNTEIKPKGQLMVVESGSRLRHDSLILGEDIQLNQIPELDGAVLDKSVEEIISKVKPKGFLWFTKPIEHPAEFNHLCTTNYKGSEVFCFIRQEPTKPSIAFQSGDDEFGPYRIRITNLRKSAAKQGYRVHGEQQESKIYVGHRLTGAENAKIKVVDICEELDDYDYLGIEHADYVCACSDRLAYHLEKQGYRNVFVLDDHFEFTEREWL